MDFDYAKLRGRIVEICGTLGKFYDEMGFSNVTGTAKMSGKIPFNQPEIYKAILILDLSMSDIPVYFFKLKVKELEQNDG